ncbi:MAG: hypothetical protein QG553_417 [Patescibacteria group bacterium]|nr:hypothetical protein [Patescibacteria group bacterium]
MKKKPSTSKTQPQQKRLHRLKNHPFVVPVMTFLGLFVISLATFVMLGGTSIGPSDSHIVHLYVDGQEQILPSRATTVDDLLARAKITLGENDVVEPARDAAITDDNFSVNVYRAYPVTIVDSDATGKKTSITAYTAQQTPEAIAKQVGITLAPEDKVEVAQPENLLQEGVISQKLVVNRAEVVNINLYGTPIVARTHATTVAEVLAEKGIKPQPTDTVTPALATPVTSNMQVFVVTVGKQIVTEEVVIPAPVQTISDPNVAAGTTVVQKEGSPGKKLTTFELQLENGKEVGRKAIQEVVSVEAVPRVIAKGTKIVNTRIGGDKSAILSAAGVPASQQSAADFIIARESGWNLAARNGSGCLGLGQACPGQKLVNACPNWQSDAVCQVGFFSGYANGRYGSWQGAYNFWLINHWW